MKLSHPIADGIGRPAPRCSRPLRLLVVLLALSAVFGVFGARAALAADPAIQLSMVPPAFPGQPTILHATVTAASGFRTGDTIAFIDTEKPANAPAIQRTAIVVDGPTTGHADLSSDGLEARAWSVAAKFIPGPASDYLLPVTSNIQVLNLGSGAPTPLDTRVSLTTSFADLNSATPAIDVFTNSSVDLTATVSELVGTGTPSGTVSFLDTATGTPVGTGPVTLVGGVAHLTVLNMGSGTHTIVASYSGGGIDNSSASTALTFFASPPVDSRLQTVTDVVVNPSPIAAGDPATITATIVQITPTGTVRALGGTVIFSAQGEHGYRVDTASVALGSAPPGFTADSNQAIIQIPSLPAGSYTITASYFGNLFGNQDSGAFTTLSVLPQRESPVVNYNGDTTGEFGHSSTFAAQITDHAGTPLANRTVTFTVGSQHCSAVSDAAGNVTCSFVVTEDPNETTLDVDVAEDLQTQGVSVGLGFTIVPEVTTLTTGFSPGPTTTALTATLLADTGAPIVNQLVALALGSQTCTAMTNGAGVATCNVNTIVGQTSAILSATYAGDTDHAASNASSTVQLVLATSVTYTGATSGVYHGATILSAKLTDGAGHPLAGRSLTFTFGTQTFSEATNASGVASVSIASLTQDPGSLSAVTVSYAGDVVSSPSTTSAPFTITKAATTLVATLPVAAGATTTLVATLKETTSGAPIAGKTVTLSLGTASCLPVTTSTTGVATCSVTTPSGSSAVLAASFAGDIDYLGSSDTKTVTLLKPSVASYTGGSSAEYHDLVIVSGTLRNAQGVALSGQTVTFSIGTQTCTGTTLSNGQAFCLILLTQPAGSYTASMSYAGNTTYAATTASAPFTITREETQLIAKVSDAIINGNSIALSAELLEDYLFPVGGRTVTLKLGTASCTATTNGLGFATCTVPRAPNLGSLTFTATFAGDAYYLPSSATRSTIVCSFPSGGSFVIGDRNSGSVNFWGSQWSKQNKLSHGDGPSSFKGWASGSFDASWGNDDDWSSDPGNSSSPPAALPTYMAVIQTGSSYKSGSRIYGDTVHIVVVKTNAGYAPNPGHDGTGTIVATVQ
jgi:hypothetical protein